MTESRPRKLLALSADVLGIVLPAISLIGFLVKILDAERLTHMSGPVLVAIICVLVVGVVLVCVGLYLRTRPKRTFRPDRGQDSSVYLGTGAILLFLGGLAGIYLL